MSSYLKLLGLGILLVTSLNAGSTWQEVSSTSAITMAQTIHSAPSKGLPQDSDEIGISDSNASFLFKKINISALKTFLFSSPTLTGTPTAPTAANGTNTDQIATTAYVLANGGSGLGVGQTWQDMTTSRNLGTTYTNNTGKPIFIYFKNGAVSSTATATVGSIEVGVATNLGGTLIPLYLLIPNGSNYSISGGSIGKWSELR